MLSGNSCCEKHYSSTFDVLCCLCEQADDADCVQTEKEAQKKANSKIDTLEDRVPLLQKHAGPWHDLNELRPKSKVESPGQQRQDFTDEQGADIMKPGRVKELRECLTLQLNTVKKEMRTRSKELKEQGTMRGHKGERQLKKLKKVQKKNTFTHENLAVETDERQTPEKHKAAIRKYFRRKK